MPLVVELFFLKIFVTWTIFKVFVEFVTILLLFYGVHSLATRHVGSLLPDHGSNLHPSGWKVNLNHWTTGKSP